MAKGPILILISIIILIMMIFSPAWAENPPRLKVVKFEYPDYVKAGDKATIDVEVVNDGGDALSGSISISFPGNPKVGIVHSDGKADIYEAGKKIWNRKLKKAVPAKDTLVELYEENWKAGVSHRLTVSVEMGSDPIFFYLRATSRGKDKKEYDGDLGEFKSFGEFADQQGYRAWLGILPKVERFDVIRNGEWRMGDPEGTGSSATMIIENASVKQFDFSISASYVSIITNEKGEEFLNANVGEIEGIAYFTSAKEAIYTNEEYPNYKMIFELEGNIINIQEINVNTGEDYGFSPGAGLNVRYFGSYKKQKSF